jgi:hypothetical protein
MMRANKQGKDFPITKELKKQLRVADISIVVMAASAVGIFAAYMAGWIAPPEAVPLPEPPSPQYWVDAAPIHSPLPLACGVAVAFLVMCSAAINPLYPVEVWWRSRQDGVRPPIKHWLSGIVSPVLRHRMLQTATFGAGCIGIALWHYGFDGVDGLRELGPSITVLLVCGWSVMLVITGKLSSFAEGAIGSAVIWLWLFPLAVRAAEWAALSLGATY